MKTHLQLKDQDFEIQFKECTLDPSLFSHEAHIRLAWIHINKYGVEQACNNICDQIERFDKTFGNGTKYNKTLTIAAVRAVHHFNQKSDASDFLTFRNEFPRLFNDFKSLIDYHYGIDIWNLEQAKTSYIEPDLIPFD